MQLLLAIVIVSISTVILTFKSSYSNFHLGHHKNNADI